MGSPAARRRLLYRLDQRRQYYPRIKHGGGPTTEWDRGRTCGVHGVGIPVAPAPADDRSGETGSLGGALRMPGLGVARR